jgi:hypothetical protein
LPTIAAYLRPGTISPRALAPAMLARRLNVSQGLVELMLADLEWAGYLRAVTGERNSCAGCGSRQACRPPQPHFWIRTGK